MKKLILLALVSLTLFAKSILILNSYADTLLWTKMQSDTIIKKMKSSNIPNLNLYVEFMDTKKFRISKQRDKNLLNYYKNKYKTKSFDMIFTTDDNALNFIIKYKNEHIFKKAKVFFSGVNNLSLQNKLDRSLFTGVFEKKDPIGNLKMAKKVVKNLKKFYLLGDAGTSANKNITQFKNAFKNIKDIKFVYINSKNLEDILKGLKHYDNHSIIMNLSTESVLYKNERINNNDKFKLLSKKNSSSYFS